jgi:uncharacterized protein (DUF305 family)
MKIKLAVLGIFLAAIAHADTTTNSMGNMDMSNMPGMEMSGGKSDGAYMTEMNSGMTKMNHDMAAAPMNGNPDHDFVTMMIPHHQGAVDMAKVELKYGHDPKMRKLAKEIIAAQDKEIAFMEAWLKTDAAKAAEGK